MPTFLRQIRFNRWYAREEYPWLAEGELQADPLGDLQTTNNSLSLWSVEDNWVNLDRVVTALAANRDHIQNLDYVIFDKQILSDLSIRVERSNAATPDQEANASWHYDLLELSAQKIVKLAEILIETIEPTRKAAKEIKQLIIAGVESQQIDLGKLKLGIRKKIETDIHQV